MQGNDESRAADLAKLRALVRRVLVSGGADLDAVEELHFVQNLGDPLGVTAATDVSLEHSMLQEAFEAELSLYVGELLADDRLTRDEAFRLRSSVIAAAGRDFDPQAALAPFEQALQNARS